MWEIIGKLWTYMSDKNDITSQVSFILIQNCEASCCIHQLQ